MGDVLRRLLYPLVLPAIVACVWAHAWGIKQEPRHMTIPPEDTAAVTGFDVQQPALSPASGYGFSSEDGFASADGE